MAESTVSLRRRKDDLTAQRDDIKKRIKYDNSQVDSLNSRISSIKNQLNGNTKELTVSDHAMLRFLERVTDMDIDTMRRTIIGELKGTTQALGDGLYPLSPEFAAKVTGNVVVTIVPTKRK